MNDLIFETMDFREKHIIASCGGLIKDLLLKAQRDWTLSETPWYKELFMVPEALYPEDFYADTSIEPNYRSPMQYWIVSDWFGEELKARNQLVTNHWGFYIWGKETADISLLQTQIFKDIYAKYLTTVLTPTDAR